MRAPSSLKLNKYTHTHTHTHTRARGLLFPMLSLICRERERGREREKERERGRDGFSLQAAAAAAAAAVPMRKQCTPWDRSPQIEAALETIMRLNDERVMLVFLLSRSVRSVALCSAIPWDTVPPSMALLSALRSH